jgi:hypothetical protein
MTLVKDNTMKYEPAERLSKSTKQGNRNVDTMPKWRAALALAYRCRVGLFLTGNLIGWGKLLHIDDIVVALFF